MANGFKVFSVGEVLTARDVNDYLMEQSIGIFAIYAIRRKLHHPEGQFGYLADSMYYSFTMIILGFIYWRGDITVLRLPQMQQVDYLVAQQLLLVL